MYLIDQVILYNSVCQLWTVWIKKFHIINLTEEENKKEKNH